MFKARLDGALSNPVWWKTAPPKAERCEIDDLKGPFQPKPFCDFTECGKYWDRLRGNAMYRGTLPALQKIWFFLDTYKFSVLDRAPERSQ